MILSYLRSVKDNKDYNHEIICLDYANPRALLTTKEICVPLKDKMHEKRHELFGLIREADICLMHWWNHPLLWDFIVREELPPCRLILWSHVLGNEPPHIVSTNIIEYCDKFVFTSPLSLELNDIKNIPLILKDKLSYIWSTSGIRHFSSIELKAHEGFIVGYIGTVGYHKLHPNFLKMCSMIDLPNIKFIVCGGPEENKIKKEAEKLGIGEKFVFTGPIENASEYLSTFDVFGYPLQPKHYGTCEQALCESMAAGIPPVVLNNPTESYIVTNLHDGIVANDEESYIKAILFLFDNPSYRKMLSKNAKETAKKRFSIENMAFQWEKTFNNVLKLPKTPKKWPSIFKESTKSSYMVFIESLGKYRTPFITYIDSGNKFEIELLFRSSPIWKSRTQGTPSHYYSFFREDNYLKIWSEIAQKLND